MPAYWNSRTTTHHRAGQTHYCLFINTSFRKAHCPENPQDDTSPQTKQPSNTQQHVPYSSILFEMQDSFACGVHHTGHCGHGSLGSPALHEEPAQKSSKHNRTWNGTFDVQVVAALRTSLTISSLQGCEVVDNNRIRALDRARSKLAKMAKLQSLLHPKRTRGRFLGSGHFPGDAIEPFGLQRRKLQAGLGSRGYLDCNQVRLGSWYSCTWMLLISRSSTLTSHLTIVCFLDYRDRRNGQRSELGSDRSDDQCELASVHVNDSGSEMKAGRR